MTLFDHFKRTPFTTIKQQTVTIKDKIGLLKLNLNSLKYGMLIINSLYNFSEKIWISF